MTMTSLVRWATDATASLASTVILRRWFMVILSRWGEAIAVPSRSGWGRRAAGGGRRAVFSLRAPPATLHPAPRGVPPPPPGVRIRRTRGALMLLPPPRFSAGYQPFGRAGRREPVRHRTCNRESDTHRPQGPPRWPAPRAGP